MTRKSQSTHRTISPTVWIAVGLIIVAAAIVLIATPSSPATNVTAPTRPPATQSAEDTYPEIPRVSLADAKAAFDAKTAVFVDVRDGDSYASAHIPGALSIPSFELENRLGELNRADWIVTYCT
jgi:hypothetical protein